MPQIILIVAQSDNRAIGRDNRMPWHLPRDLRHFKQHTLGSPVVMGRKTYDSIGRALPGRQNLVISRNPALNLPDAEVCPNLAAALMRARGESVYILGGSELYHDALPLANALLVTHVHTTIADADRYFPPINPDIWQATGREYHPADAENPYDMTFVRYEKTGK